MQYFYKSQCPFIKEMLHVTHSKKYRMNQTLKKTVMKEEYVKKLKHETNQFILGTFR